MEVLLSVMYPPLFITYCLPIIGNKLFLSGVSIFELILLSSLVHQQSAYSSSQQTVTFLFIFFYALSLENRLK